MASLRAGCLVLAVETGRYWIPKVPLGLVWTPNPSSCTRKGLGSRPGWGILAVQVHSLGR